MSVYHWSQTAASNGNADLSAVFPEGMAPSAVNDSARGLMAGVAKYRDDISGSIVTSGTSSAYSISTYSGFDNFAHLSGQVVAFSPHATNGQTVTLNVDGLGPKPLRSAPGAELQAATIIQGTPYLAVYNSTDGVFYLQGFFGNPYNIPLFGGMDYWDTIAPNSSFIFPLGQALSRTGIYAPIFARWGTKYGAGDGSTTFNAPNKTGRVSAMMEATATRLTAGYFGGDSTQLGAVGGSESYALTVANLAAHTPTVASFTQATYQYGRFNVNSVTGAGGGGPGITGYDASVPTAAVITGAASVTMSPIGSSTPHPIVQPTIVCNYIIRVI